MSSSKSSSMQTVGSILTRFNPLEDKYISREFQAFGVHLSEELGDYKHKSLYIKLAKTIPRALLEKALSFCVDSKAKREGALFMWKLKELGAWKQVSKVDIAKKRKRKIVEDIPF